MNQTVKKLTNEARALPAEDLADLVDELLVTLHQIDPDIEKAWAEEAERRVDAYLKGETTTRDASEVFAKYRKP